MNTSSDAVKGAETATERLQLKLDRLRSERDITEKKRLEVRSRQDERSLAASRRLVNARDRGTDVTEQTKIERR